MLKTEVTVNTKKWDKLKGELKDLESAFTTCGLHKDETYPNGLDIAFVGAVNEFGTIYIPSRPWIRGWFDGKLNDIKNIKRRIRRFRLLWGY